MTRLRQFAKSFRHALRGLSGIARSEQSFRVQLVVGILAILLAFLLPLALWERILVILLSAAVLVLEVLNTIMERFADAVQPRLSSMVGEVKDMMAGAVFLTALTAAVVGIMIFYPHFYTLVCVILKSSGGR